MKKRLVPDFELAFEHADELTGFQLWKVANLWQRKMKESLDPLGITPVQFLLLNSIATLNNQQSGAITQNRLAEFADCDKMMVSKVLRTLEERKLVERRAHHSDTRSRSLFITNKGMELLRAASPVLLQTEAAFFEALGKKEKTCKSALRSCCVSTAGKPVRPTRMPRINPSPRGNFPAVPFFIVPCLPLPRLQGVPFIGLR